MLILSLEKLVNKLFHTCSSRKGMTQCITRGLNYRRTVMLQMRRDKWMWMR